jgi:hypothetical protein
LLLLLHFSEADTMRLSVVFALLAFVALALAQGPHLIAQKSVVGDAVEGRNMTVEIKIWNVGNEYVLLCHLKESDFSSIGCFAVSVETRTT